MLRLFHLAALIAIPFSYVTPNSYVETNIKGTLNIYQAAKENGISRLITLPQVKYMELLNMFQLTRNILCNHSLPTVQLK